MDAPKDLSKWEQRHLDVQRQPDALPVHGSVRPSRAACCALGGVDTDLDLCLFAHHGRCWVSLLVLRTSVDHRERKRLKMSQNVEDRGKEGRVR